MVDKVVDKRGTAQSSRGLPRIPVLRRRPGHRRQHFYRPRDPAVAASAKQFADVKLFTIDEVFWRLGQSPEKPISTMGARSIKSMENERRPGTRRPGSSFAAQRISNAEVLA